MYGFKNKKTIVMLVLCVMLGFMAVGYSFLMSELKINSSASISSTWDIRITGISCSNESGNAYNLEEPTFTATKAIFKIVVTDPGDVMNCTVTIQNQGTIAGILNSLTMSSSGSDAISYQMQGLAEGDTIAVGETKYLYVSSTYETLVEYDPTYSMNKLEVGIDWLQYAG